MKNTSKKTMIDPRVAIVNLLRTARQFVNSKHLGKNSN